MENEIFNNIHLIHLQYSSLVIYKLGNAYSNSFYRMDISL